MVRKLCAWFLAFSLCLPAIPAVAVEDDEAALLYLDIRPSSQAAVTRCPVLVKDQRIYLSAEDLAWAAEYELEWDKDALFFGRDSALLNVGAFLDTHEAVAMGRTFDLPMIEHEGMVFLDMEKALYLLHAQWCVEQDRLVVDALDSNLFDFWMQNSVDLYWLMITTSDLMQGGETEWEFAWRTALASLINDFDLKSFYPPAVLDEKCEEALLLLLEEDEELLTADAVMAIDELLASNAAENAADFMSDIVDIMEMPSNVNELVELYKQAEEIKPTLKFSVWNDMSQFNFDVMSKKLEAVGTAVTIFDFCSSVNEVYTRSSQWGEDFIDCITLLSQINDATYESAGKELSSAADRLLKEKSDPLSTAFLKGTEEFYLLAAEELTPAGKFVSIVNASMAILKAAPSLKAQIESADLMHTVNQLTHVEWIAFCECANAYELCAEVQASKEFSGDGGVLERMIYSGLESGEPIEERSIERLRNAATLLLRSIVRAQGLSYSFYTNPYVNDRYVQSVADEKLQELYKSYALLIELQESEKNDPLLILEEDFQDLYSDQYGAARVRVDLDILQEEAETFSDEEAAALYMDFLENEAYLPYISHWWCEPAEYALLDVDQDGVSELFLQGADGGGFYNFAVFGIDTKTEQIVSLLLPDKSLVNERYPIFSCYGGLSYDARQNAIALMELRPMGMGEKPEMYVLQEGEFYSAGPWSRSDVLGEAILFTPLPAGAKTDLTEYLDLSIYEFVELFGPMHRENNGDPMFSTDGITVAGVEEGTIHYILIDSECDYSLGGVEYGMALEDAQAVVTNRGYTLISEPPVYGFLLSETAAMEEFVHFRVDDTQHVDGIEYIYQYK